MLQQHHLPMKVSVACVFWLLAETSGVYCCDKSGKPLLSFIVTKVDIVFINCYQVTKQTNSTAVTRWKPEEEGHYAYFQHNVYNLYTERFHVKILNLTNKQHN